jgi:hypothetical protein
MGRPIIGVRLQIEILEDRVVPGLLTVSPIGNSDSYIHPDAYIHALPAPPHVGLTIAQGHSGGVVQWTPST